MDTVQTDDLRNFNRVINFDIHIQILYFGHLVELG